ncbi:MAG: hypothetical protein HZB13_15215 [Acidobacteria bacterium]|nr:hypothetical protein [Acidobacteriota bacterium]
MNKTNSPIRRVVNEFGDPVVAPATVSAAGGYSALTPAGPGTFDAIYQVTEVGSNPGVTSVIGIPILVAFDKSTVSFGTAIVIAGMAPRDASENAANQTAPRFGPTLISQAQAFRVRSDAKGNVTISARSFALSRVLAVPFTVTGPAGCLPGSYQTPKQLQWDPWITCKISFAADPIFLNAGERLTGVGWSGSPIGADGTVQTTPGDAAYTMTFNRSVLVKPVSSPSTCGTTMVNLSAAPVWVAEGSSVNASATPVAACLFKSFSTSTPAGLYNTNPASIPVADPLTVVGNYISSKPILAIGGYTKSGTAAARLFTIKLKTATAASATNLRVTAASMQPNAGTCAPAVSTLTSMPVALGNLAGNSTVDVLVQFATSGCAALPAATLFRITLTAVSDNGGSQVLSFNSLR